MHSLKEYYKGVVSAKMRSNYVNTKYESYLQLNICGIQYALEQPLVGYIDSSLEPTLEIENVSKFISWSFNNKYPLDWRLHIFYLYYLSCRGYKANLEFVERCMVAAASQWTYSEKSSLLSIAISNSSLDRFVIACRSKDATIARDVYVVNESLSCKKRYSYRTSLNEYDTIEDIYNTRENIIC